MLIESLILASTGGAIGYVYTSLNSKILKHEAELSSIKQAVQQIKKEVARIRQDVNKTDCPYKVGQPLKFFNWNERTKEMEPLQGKVTNIVYDKNETMIEVKTKQFTYTLPLSKIVVKKDEDEKSEKGK